MDLKINFEETISVGNQITTKSEEFKELLSKIRNVNSNLKTAWEGSDATKYTSAVEEQAISMDKLAMAMDELGAFVSKVGKTYQEVSETNSSAINY